jgi:hypothetical protein
MTPELLLKDISNDAYIRVGKSYIDRSKQRWARNCKHFGEFSLWTQIMSMSGWAYKATFAPLSLFDLLCVPRWFIPPVVPYLWQSTVSYITKCHYSILVSLKCLSKRRNLNSAKATHSQGICETVSLPCGTSLNWRACSTGLLLMAFAIFSVDFLWFILVPQELEN